jgi:spore coat polysaccharide biosynthesis protein SpsF
MTTESHRRRVVAIIQARMGSTRLPGKVLSDIGGQPMLARVVERARRAKTVDEVAVATTTDPADEVVAAMCAEKGYAWVRGHPADVLDRYHQAARRFQADVIVRLTADCPLIDPEVIDLTVRAFLDADPPVDLVANRLPQGRTFPIGLDTEVCSFTALGQAWTHAKQPHEREHVMPYLYEVPGRFRVVLVNNDKDYGMLRWTVDTADDLELVRAIYARFKGRDDFSWIEVLKLFEKDPSLGEINAGVRHKTHRDVG